MFCPGRVARQPFIVFADVDELDGFIPRDAGLRVSNRNLTDAAFRVVYQF